jgi:hypothetical protein
MASLGGGCLAQSTRTRLVNKITGSCRTTDGAAKAGKKMGRPIWPRVPQDGASNAVSVP